MTAGGCPRNDFAARSEHSIDWQRGTIVCLVWLVAGSVLAGAAMTLHTGRLLATFGAERITSVVVTVSFARVIGARVAGLATWLGIVSATQRMRATAIPYAAFAVIPVNALLSMAYGIAAGFGCLVLFLHVDPRAAIQEVRLYCELADLGVGIVRAGLYAVALSCLAGLVLRPFQAHMRGRWARFLGASFAAGCAMAAVELAMWLAAAVT